MAGGGGCRLSGSQKRAAEPIVGIAATLRAAGAVRSFDRLLMQTAGLTDVSGAEADDAELRESLGNPDLVAVCLEVGDRPAEQQRGDDAVVEPCVRPT
ncbi:hypothetical protein [Cryptosporangium minutisporangium]|uniref:Uncharacterized protein n=1 Tax=Cryptosporangium minutisporangium TaxID=113569 RepID=A0ABP6SZU8_9ACTN